MNILNHRLWQTIREKQREKAVIKKLETIRGVRNPSGLYASLRKRGIRMEPEFETEYHWSADWINAEKATRRARNILTILAGIGAVTVGAGIGILIYYII